MWFTSRHGNSYGPFSDDQMRDFVAAGKLIPNDFVWKQGMVDWMPAKRFFRFPEIAKRVSPVVYPNPYGDFSSPVQSCLRKREVASVSRIGAALLAIFLGWLGAHKFYLGFPNAGLIMLAVSFFSCGIGIFLVAFVGVIEGLIYTSTSDQEFNAIYVQGRKEWW